MKYNNCKLHETKKEFWADFKKKGDYSNFECYAIHKAFKEIGLHNTKGNNFWCWCNDGELTQATYKYDGVTIDLYSALFVTENGNLVLKEYNGEWEQVAQYVVEMEFSF